MLGKSQITEYKSSQEFRELVKKNKFSFHTHSIGIRSDPSGQDIFSANISTAEVIFTEPKQGKREIVILLPSKIFSIDKLVKLRTTTFGESLYTSDMYGNDSQLIYSELARERLEPIIKKVEL